MSLVVVPLTFRDACAFIAAHHRHHRPPRGMKFAIGVRDREHLVGVATVGRPVARHLDDGATVEVTRTCTAGARNANSKLYGAARRQGDGIPAADHLHPARRDGHQPARRRVRGGS
jgi:hypothetical protein